MTTRRGSKRKGTDYEREYRKELEKRGYHVMRSAGSHGPFDLFAYCWLDAFLAQAKDDGRGCKSAQNLVRTLWARDVPEGVSLAVVHPLRYRRFCEHWCVS